MAKKEGYFKRVYSKVWQRRVQLYGFDDYLKAMVKLIKEKAPSSVFELAIGTAWPIAKELADAGVNVSGCDIAEELIDVARSKYPEINSFVSGYEDLMTDKKYDTVYCLRSTWYFRDILQALDKMFSIVKEDGYVVFDIMNADSPVIKRNNLVHYIKTPLILLKNAARTVLNIFGGKYQCDTLIMAEIPTSPKTVDAFLKEKDILFEKYSYNQIMNTSDTFDSRSFRLVYVCKATREAGDS